MLTRLYVRMHINYREVSEMLRDFDEDEGRIVRVLAGNDRVSRPSALLPKTVDL